MAQRSGKKDRRRSLESFPNELESFSARPKGIQMQGSGARSIQYAPLRTERVALSGSSLNSGSKHHHDSKNRAPLSFQDSHSHSHNPARQPPQRPDESPEPECIPVQKMKTPILKHVLGSAAKRAVAVSHHATSPSNQSSDRCRGEKRQDRGSGDGIEPREVLLEHHQSRPNQSLKQGRFEYEQPDSEVSQGHIEAAKDVMPAEGKSQSPESSTVLRKPKKRRLLYSKANKKENNLLSSSLYQPGIAS